jgi:hypothetical protein
VSVQDEREFRERLGGLLDGIEPAPAPVFRAMRQGRGIRMRRWVSAAAGLAVLAAAAVAVPFFLHQTSRTAPVAPLHYSVTVDQPSPHWKSGLVGEGTENGHRWSVVLSGRGNGLMVLGSDEGIVFGTNFTAGSAPAAGMHWAGGRASSMSVLGILRHDVTSVTVVLSNGERLELTPVTYEGQRYVAITIPRNANITSVEAMRGHIELAYSIPYQVGGWDNWWQPGQTQFPPRAAKTLATGFANGLAWQIRAQFGPWGYCWTVVGGDLCADGLHPYSMPSKQLDELISCEPQGPGGAPFYNLFAVQPDIARVMASFHGQRGASYRTVEVAGLRFLLIITGQHSSITSAVAYNAAGQRIGALGDLSCGQS